MADQDVAGRLVHRSRNLPAHRSVPGSQMMADAPASERAYQHLKSAILGGKLRPEILDIRGLGDQLRMSATPVREALARLSAERLVRFVPQHGYAVVRLTAQRLEQLYDLNGLLLEACLRRAARSDLETGIHAIPPLATAYADRISALSETIAGAQPNRELLAQVEGVTRRLFLARQTEPRFFPDADIEAARLASLWACRNYAELGRQLEDHHRRRIILADPLARVLDTSPDAC